MTDEGLADVEAANPFVYPDFTQESVRPSRVGAAQASSRPSNHGPLLNATGLVYAGQAPTAEMAVAPPSIRKSAPTTYAESSDAR
jgi:hypothetical protein